MKTMILDFLGVRVKTQIWFKNNSTPYTMYCKQISWERNNESFNKISWTQVKEEYAFLLDDVIAIKSKRVWAPFK